MTVVDWQGQTLTAGDIVLLDGKASIVFDVTSTSPGMAVVQDVFGGYRTDFAVRMWKIPTAPGGPPTGAAGGDLSGTYPNPSVQDDSHAHTAATLPATIVYDGDAAGGDLTGTFPSPTIVADAVTFAKMSNLATDRLIGRDTAGTGDPEALTVGGGVEFTGSGGIQRSALNGDTTSAAGSGTTSFRPMSALSVLGNNSALAVVPGDIAASAASGAVLRESGSTIGFGTVATEGIADAAVTLAKMANLATDKILGRDTAGTGVPEALDVSGGLEFTGTGIRRSALTGDVTASAGSNATTIANSAVTDAKLRDGTKRSVVGRSAATDGVVADIVATPSSDGVLRESGGTLGFGTIAAAGIASDAVTTAKILNGNVTLAKVANSTALSVLGRSGNSVGVYADITATAATGAVLRENGSVVGFGTIAAAGIASDAVTTAKILDANVTLAKIANATACSLLGRSANSAGAYADIAIGTDAYHVVRRAAVLAAEELCLQNAWDPRAEAFDHWDFTRGPFDWTQWNNAGSGGVYLVAGTSTNPGKIRVDSSGTLNGYAGCYPVANAYAVGGGAITITVLFQPLADGTGAELFIGLSDKTTGSGVAANAIGAYYLKATSANWLYKTVAASTATTTTGATAVTFTPVPFTRLDIEINAAGTSVVFKLDGVTKATHTTNIPTAAMHMTLYCKNGLLLAYTCMDVDYVGVRLKGLTR